MTKKLKLDTEIIIPDFVSRTLDHPDKKIAAEAEKLSAGLAALHGKIRDHEEQELLRIEDEIDALNAKRRKLIADDAPKPARKSVSRKDRNPESAKIREWAIGQGIKMSERGRISAGIRDAYYAGHVKES